MDSLCVSLYISDRNVDEVSVINSLFEICEVNVLWLGILELPISLVDSLVVSL